MYNVNKLINADGRNPVLKAFISDADIILSFWGGFVACGRRRPLATPQRTQNSVKACEPLQSGDASRLVLGIFLFHYRTFYHRKNGLRCVVLCYIKQRLFAKVMFSADAIVQACTFIVETLIHFVLAQL